MIFKDFIHLAISYFFCAAIYVIILNEVNDDKFKIKNPKITKYVNYFFCFLLIISFSAFCYSYLTFEVCNKNTFSCEIASFLGKTFFSIARATTIFFFPSLIYLDFFDERWISLLDILN